MRKSRNLFATVLTYPAPSSNYRGESEENRTILQKITKGGQEYSIISPESMRNALREMLANVNSEWCNRSRLHYEDQLAVEFKEFPNAERYADDFLFGYLVTDKKSVEQNKKKPAKRDSVFRVNMAVALTPYRFNSVFHQSPRSPINESKNSALVHREVAYTAYQYPFALSYADCKQGNGPQWTQSLLEAIGQLTNVAGGHARSYYEMSPTSIIVRLTPNLVAGYNTYGFDEQGNFPELKRINFKDTQTGQVSEKKEERRNHDLPGNEFWIGGEIVRKLDDTEKKRLVDFGVNLYDNPQKLIADVGKEFLGPEGE